MCCEPCVGLESLIVLCRLTLHLRNETAMSQVAAAVAYDAAPMHNASDVSLIRRATLQDGREF